MPEVGEEHWQKVYATRQTDEVSWFQATPVTSLRLIAGVGGPQTSVLDVGAGASALVDALVAAAYSDITVLDVSEQALAVVRDRLDDRSSGVTLVHADLLGWEPRRTFDVWHDRALFHFLVDPEARARYVRVLGRAVAPGGSVVVATFAKDGPTSCSGLPVCRYDGAALADELGAGFALVHTEREEHRTPAGVMQPFTWDVLTRR